MLRTGNPLWAGDNPYIRLFDPERPGRLLGVGSFFRVQYSPVGSGHVALLSTGLDGERPRVRCLADNPELGNFLFSSIAHRFTGFDGVLSPGELEVESAEFETISSPGDQDVVEQATSARHQLELRWSGLGEPFYVEFVHGKLPYRLFSLFVPASTGAITLDGDVLPGEPGSDVVEGRTITTACLALAETWLSEAEAAE